jgi:hypothetical protein
MPFYSVSCRLAFPSFNSAIVSVICQYVYCRVSNKQIEMLVKLQEDIKKYLDEEYEASVEAEQGAKDDDNTSTDEGDDDDFDVAI